MNTLTTKLHKNLHKDDTKKYVKKSNMGKSFSY